MEGITDKDFQELVAKIEKATGETIDTKTKEALKNIEPDVFKEIVTNSKVLKDLEEKNEKLEETLKEQGIALSKLKEEGTPINGKTLSEQIGKGLKDNLEALKSLKEGDNKNNVRIQLKAAGDMLISGADTNIVGGAQIPQADREAGITRVVRRSPFILGLVNRGTISSNLWEWVQQVNPDGDAAMTEEGAKKAQIDFDLALASAPVRKVTAFIKASKEMLDDVELIRSEIDQELIEKINLKIDGQLLSGDGTGQNLTGILQNATAFAAGSFVDSVNEANNADVLRISINQIRVAQFVPNYILMHPSDVTSMELDKGSDGHYIMPPFRSIDGTVVKGLPVVENTGVTEGDFLVGDFTKSGVRFREGLTIDVGYENDDFTKNFVTILAEARLVHRVKSNHYAAFVTGNFAAARALIETP